MSYFQNPLDAEFQGNLLLSDRQYTMTFKVKGNLPNSSMLLTAWNAAPYNVSSKNALMLNYSFDAGNTWTQYTVANVGSTALNTSEATAYEVAAALTADATFNALFVAGVNQVPSGPTFVTIKKKTFSTQPNSSRERFKCYVSNGGAESILRFNKKAGVAEFPSYFARHTIANKSQYTDSVGMLVALNPMSGSSTRFTDQQIIQEAGLSHNISISSTTVTIGNTLSFQVGDSVVIFDGTNTLNTTISAITANTSLTLASGAWSGATEAQLVDIHADYQLLRGRSGMFQFQNNEYNGSGQLYSVIEYSAGALPGDLAKKTTYAYGSTGPSAPPTISAEVPYTLTSGDLVTPP